MTINALSLITAQSNRKPYKFDIPNSLRFDDQSETKFTRTFSGLSSDVTTATLSFWVKRTKLDHEGTIICRDGNPWFCVFAANKLATRTNPGGWHYYSDRVYRDPYAWYHIFIKVNSSDCTLYVNGQLEGTATYPGAILTTGSSELRLGYESSNNSHFAGYLSEFYFIDETNSGSSLDVNDFGRTDKYGNWVPKKVTNTNYGNNGFYLDFSDRTDIGADRSGNNNHFTPSGFDTTINTDIVTNIATSTGTDYLSGATLNSTTEANAEYAFDSNLGTPFNGPCAATTGNTQSCNHSSRVTATIEYEVGSEIPVSSSLRVYYRGLIGGTHYGGSLYFKINGTQYGSGSGGPSWVEVPVSTPFNIESIGIDGSNQSDNCCASASLFAIEVDGVILKSNDTEYTLTFNTGTSISSFSRGDIVYQSPSVYGTVLSVDSGNNQITLGHVTGTFVTDQTVYKSIADQESYYDYDYMNDSPTNNYATLNGLFQNPSSKSTLSDGNLTMVTSTSGNGNVLATLPIKNSGKWYWEVEYDKADYVSIGVAKEERTITEGGTYPGSGYLGIDQYGWALQLPSTASTWTYGRLAHNVSLNDHANVSATDVGPKYPRNGNDLITNSIKNTISVLMDADSGALDFYINGSKQDDRPAFEETKTSAITNVTNNGGSNYTWSGTASNGYHHHALYAIPSTRSLTAAELNDINTTGSVFLPGNSQVGSGAKTAVVTFSPALTPDSGSDISVEISSDGAGPSCGSVAEINGTTYANGTHTISANITTLSGYTSYNSCANGFKRVNLNPGGTANYNIFVDDEVVLTFQDSTNLSKYRVGDLVYAVQNTNHSGIISAISGNTLTIRTPNKQRDGSSTSWQQGWTITRDLNYVDFTYPLYPAFGDWYNTQAETIRVNFGQQPFKYDLPAGYAPLCTKNLPAQKFIDGTDHFRTILANATTGNYTSGVVTNVTNNGGKNYTITNQDTLVHGVDAIDFNAGNSGSNEVFFYGGTCGLECSNTLTIAFSPALSGTSITLKYQFPHTAQCQYQHTGEDTLTITGSSNLSYTSSSCGVAVSPSLTSLSQISATGKQGTGHAYFGNITVDGSNDNIFIDDQIVLTFANSSDVTGFAAGQLIYKQGDTAVRGKVESVNSASSPYTITIRSNSTWGNGDVLQTTDLLNEARTIFPSGLWWIKDRQNNNQHQLVDSVRGNTIASQTPSSTKNATYVPPTGNSVAWCWNSANPELSGFNIIEYTGDANATQAIAHGLPGTPEFIITGSQGATPGGYETFHVGCSAGKSLTIDSPAAEQTDTRYSGVDATNITYGSDYNNNGQLMIAYAWTSIPGYSAFGTYTGNNNIDGTFVYTGFKPAFVLIKNTTNNNGWAIYDSSRNPYNPADLYLFANTQSGDPSPARQTDLLSNGFKSRNTGIVGNQAYTYIYAAFAEKPSFAKNFSSTNPR